MESDSTFEAISFDSKRGVNPIMIYRLKSDPSKCFKFIRRRDSCYKCKFSIFVIGIKSRVCDLN